MFQSIKTRSDFDGLSQEDKEIFLNILAGACVKQKEENNQIVDYYDFSPLKAFEISETELNLPELKSIAIDLKERKAIKKQDCLNLLESAFDRKHIEIMAIACDKEGSDKYIKAQYEFYVQMRKNADNGLYSPGENEAIITANDAAHVLTAPLIILINELRHEFQRLINAEIEVKEDLELFKVTKVSKEDNGVLTDLHIKLKGM